MSFPLIYQRKGSYYNACFRHAYFGKPFTEHSSFQVAFKTLSKLNAKEERNPESATYCIFKENQILWVAQCQTNVYLPQQRNCGATSHPGTWGHIPTVF